MHEFHTFLIGLEMTFGILGLFCNLHVGCRVSFDACR